MVSVQASPFIRLWHCLSLAGVRELLLLDRNEQLKVTAVGLKLFERQEAKVRPALLLPSRCTCANICTWMQHIHDFPGKCHTR